MSANNLGALSAGAAMDLARRIIDEHLGRAGARVDYEDAEEVGLSADPSRAGMVEDSIARLLRPRGLWLETDEHGYVVLGEREED